MALSKHLQRIRLTKNRSSWRSGGGARLVAGFAFREGTFP